MKKNKTKNHNKAISPNGYYYQIKTVKDAPLEFQNNNHFSELLFDPAHKGRIVPGVIRESMAIIEAEKQGTIKAPASRPDIPEIDFYDKDGVPYDIKTPPSPPPSMSYPFDYSTAGESVISQLEKSEKNKITGKEEPVKVLLDTSYLTKQDKSSLLKYIEKNANDEQKKRISFIEIDFSKKLQNNLINNQLSYNNKTR